MKMYKKCKCLLVFLLIAMMVLQQGGITTFAGETGSMQQTSESSELVGGGTEYQEVDLKTDAEQTDISSLGSEDDVSEEGSAEESSQDETSIEMQSAEDTSSIADSTDQTEQTSTQSDSLQLPTEPINLETALSNVTIVKVNGEPYDASKKYPRGSTVEFSLTYQFSEDNKPSLNGTHVSTYVLPSGLKVPDKTGDIDGGTYTAGAGTYTIANNVVTFTYTDGFLEAHPDQISGTFTFTGTLDESITENKDNATIEFTGNGKTFPIIINFEDGKVTGNKSYALNSDGTIDFTIKMKVSDRDVVNVKLTDVQGSNLKFADDPQFKLNGVTITDVTMSDNTVNLNLGNLAIGEYEITYKAELIDKSANPNENNQNKNSVQWTWTGGQNSTETTVVPVEKMFKKTGSASKNDAGENIITWTVIYIPGSFGSIAGKTFTDTLGADQKYAGTYEVYYDPNGSQYYVGGSKIDSGSITEDASGFSYTFPTTQTASQGGYKIVYQTKVTKDFTGKETFTNNIKTDNDEANGTVDITNKNPSLDIVSKSGEADQDNRQATWTVNVKSNGQIVNNLVITDTLQDNNNWKGKYLDDVTVTETINGIATTLKSGEDYTAVADNSAGTMVVTFSKAISGDVAITYKTDYSGSDNTGSVGNKIHSS